MQQNDFISQVQVEEIGPSDWEEFAQWEKETVNMTTEPGVTNDVTNPNYDYDTYFFLNSVINQNFEGLFSNPLMSDFDRAVLATLISIREKYSTRADSVQYWQDSASQYLNFFKATLRKEIIENLG